MALIAIALFHPVFAVAHGDPVDIAPHAGIAVAFTPVAIVGYRTRFALIEVGLIDHALFDLIAHLGLDSPAPEWWGPFCIGIDVVLGVWFLTLRPNPR